ncbi:MAG: 1-acyl-sn-glycerol-3-phosphate acyltransferase, partial [bacterium]
WHQIQPILFQKTDRFFTTGAWPYNETLFDPAQALAEKRPILFCLNLPKGTRWIEAGHEAQREIFRELLSAQADFEQPLQLIPLHFIYDKHPGRAKKSLMDIVFGNRENPGYLRKMILFLRNYKKRAVAKIGEPLDLRKLAGLSGGGNTEAVAERISIEVQRAFEIETRQVTGPKLQSRRSFLEKILQTQRFREQLEHIATQNNLSFEKAEKKALGYLREIASDIRFTVIELWDFFLSWLFNSLYDGLEVDQEGLARIKKVAKDSPMVLIPCHKSHVDYLLLSYIFYQNDLSLPHVCAGINLNFWPLGPIFRRSGGYFIRRSLPGDALYPLALKSYVKELMHEGYFQEFFIEGTRSRSGKLFPPKTGLLNMMVESFADGGIPEVYFVPVALGYERVLEEGAYLKESKGAKKSQEKFSDLLRLPKFLRRRYGKVYLQFAEPISLREALKDQGETPQSEPVSLKPVVAELAERICVAINEVSTLMPSAPVASALLAPHGKSITPQQVMDRARELLAYARQSGARLSQTLRDKADESMEEVLAQFVAEGLVREHHDIEGRFFTVKEETRSHLDFFKNQGIHCYARPAMELLCERKAPGRFEELRSLLNKEFFFAAKPKQAEGAPPAWMSDLLLPILESYWLSLYVIEQIAFEKWDERKLSHKVLELGETLKMRGTLEYSESLSRFPIQNAIVRFVELGILKNHQEDMGPAGKKLYSPGPDLARRESTLLLLETLLCKPHSAPRREGEKPSYPNVIPLVPKSEKA